MYWLCLRKRWLLLACVVLLLGLLPAPPSDALAPLAITFTKPRGNFVVLLK